MPTFSLTCNGQRHRVDAEGSMPLLYALRDQLNLTGTKYGCGIGACGACTVHIDGKPAKSCLTPVASVGARPVTTIEGLAKDGTLTRVQDAWIAEDVAQCGYCQAGQIMAATALLESTPRPTDQQIDAAMSGNICRCATYERIRRAIHRAAAR